MDNLGFSGNEAAKMLLNALERYNSKDYPTAKLTFKILIEQHPEMTEPPFFLAMCQLKTGDFDRAKAGFEKIQSGEFADATRFHLAELLVRTDQQTEAKKLLSNLAAKPGEFQDKAKAILDEW
jgi:TolA-binding protein